MLEDDFQNYEEIHNKGNIKLRGNIELRLVRHAQSKANLTPHIFCGQSNFHELTAEGIGQAAALGEKLKGEIFDILCSSSAVRAMTTIKIIAETIGYPINNIIESDSLLEHQKGVWEGQPREEVLTPEIIRDMEENPLHFKHGINGESVAEVRDRMRRFIDNTLFNYIIKDQNIVEKMKEGKNVKGLIGGHQAAIQYRLEDRFNKKFPIDNTGVTKVIITVYKNGKKKWKLKEVNNIDHLIGVGNKYSDVSPRVREKLLRLAS